MNNLMSFDKRLLSSNHNPNQIQNIYLTHFNNAVMNTIRSFRIFRLLGYAPRREIMWAHFMKFLMDILPKCFQRVGPCPFPPGSGECQHYSALSVWPPWHVLTSPQQESSTFSSWKHIVTLSWQYLPPSDHSYVCIFMYKNCSFCFQWAYNTLHTGNHLCSLAVVIRGTTYLCQCLPDGIMSHIFSVFFGRDTVFLVAWALKLMSPG